MKYFDLMNEACEKIGVSFDEDKYNKFILYKEMLQQWNEKVNLTAITEDEEIIKKHFIDCIKCYSFSKLKEAETIIDIGTGAGFPGIPIGIIDNDKKIVLLDSLNKRVTFLKEVIQALNLKNITAYHGRAEEYIKSFKCREVFDVAISRAVANMTVLSELCIPYVNLEGYFVAMKGPSVDEELSDAKNAITTLGGLLENVVEIEIEDSDLKHNLVVIKKIKKTPDVYPRKSGTAGKKPIK
jgi:16S rRNA (guanine527-N7)-methyltransferase